MNLLNLKRFPLFKDFFNYYITRKLQRYPHSKIIVWLYNPAEYEIFDLFPNAIKVFDTIDNWAEMRRSQTWYDRSLILAGYEHICKRNILIISNGKMMTEFYISLRKFDNSILEIPNGVDSALFSINEASKAGVPNDLLVLPRPIIGYVGVLQERLNLDLLYYLVKNNPSMTFVIIGKINPFNNFKLNMAANNLVFLGERRYCDIPRYILGFDACIMPHVSDSMTCYMSPMKIYEYLSMGKPVISTRVCGIEKITDYIYIADEPKTFGMLIKKAISENSCKLAGLRREEAVKHSWVSKFTVVMNKINEMETMNTKYE